MRPATGAAEDRPGGRRVWLARGAKLCWPWFLTCGVRRRRRARRRAIPRNLHQSPGTRGTHFAIHQPVFTSPWRVRTHGLLEAFRFRYTPSLGVASRGGKGFPVKSCVAVKNRVAPANDRAEASPRGSGRALPRTSSNRGRGSREPGPSTGHPRSESSGQAWIRSRFVSSDFSRWRSA